MQRTKWKYILTILLLITVSVWLAVLTSPDKKLHLITCDVGQGDATLIVLGKTQILIDGGPNNKVIDCLSKHLPFWDREIEIVMLSHPQTDHYTGLIEVFRRYKVDYFLANSLDSSTPAYKVLKNLVGGRGTKVINPLAGMVLRYQMIQLDVLSPSRQFLEDNGNKNMSSNDGVLGTFTSSVDPNEFSIVAILSYKDFDALFTGDIGNRISDEVADEIEKSYEKSLEYIKVPHHGSKNGLTKSLLVSAGSKIALISAGRNNSYGHPHEEVIEMLKKVGAEIYRTDQMGDVVIVSDGKNYWFFQ